MLLVDSLYDGVPISLTSDGSRKVGAEGDRDNYTVKRPGFIATGPMLGPQSQLWCVAQVATIFINLFTFFEWCEKFGPKNLPDRSAKVHTVTIR